MTSKMNAVVKKADVHFYPDMMKSVIEIVAQYDRGNVCLSVPMTSNTMYNIIAVFNSDTISGIVGKYCRIFVDDDSGRIDGIGHILYDCVGMLENDPDL